MKVVFLYDGFSLCYKKALEFYLNRFFLVVFLSYLSIGILFLTFVFTISYIVIHPPKSSVIGSPENYNITYENINFTSKDGTNLKGWWIPSQLWGFERESKNTVVFSHGFGDSRTNMPIDSLLLAKRLASEGYNILMFDFRNAGESSGKITTVGYYEKEDVLAAVKFSKKIKNSEKVALMGWSMGAASSILAAGDTEDVQAVIADSSFSDFKEYFELNFNFWANKFSKEHLKVSINIPNIILNSVLTTSSILSSTNLDEVSPEKAVKNMDNKGLFLIHGKKDGAINYSHSEKIYENSDKNNTFLWINDLSGHIRSYNHFGVEYENKILEFLENYMN